MGNVNSPTKAIRTQLASMAISQQPTNQLPQNSGNLFGSTSGGRGNLFNARMARPPATEEEKTTLKTSLSLYPIQLDTPEGEALYLDQLRAWRCTNGDNHVTKFTGFPLCPGGAPSGSGECYNCGRTGHRRIDCQETGSKKIPQFEVTLRAICGSILGQPGCHIAQINYLAGEDEFVWLNAESTGHQGNGEGPSAL